MAEGDNLDEGEAAAKQDAAIAVVPAVPAVPRTADVVESQVCTPISRLNQSIISHYIDRTCIELIIQ